MPSTIETSGSDSGIDLDEVIEAGHPGDCDQPGCGRPIQRAIAVRSTPGCVCGGRCAHGNAALAFYCGRHGSRCPVATLSEVQSNATWRPGRMWSLMAENWPHPVAVTNDDAKAV